MKEVRLAREGRGPVRKLLLRSRKLILQRELRHVDIVPIRVLNFDLR